MWTEIGMRAVGKFLLRIVFDLNKAAVVHHDIIAVQHSIEEAKSALEEIQELFGDEKE